MFDDDRWAEVPAVAEGITRLSELDLYREETPAKGPPRCLDLCCGFGRIGLELARRGFSVTGVDITEPYLETGRDEAAEEELDAEFILDDIRSFTRPGFFDLAVNLYNSFGYFEDPEDDALVVRNVLESLKPGGVFFIETLGKELWARDFTEGEWFRRAGYLVLTEYEVLDSWGSLKSTWRLIPDTRKGPPWYGPDTPGELLVEKTFVHRLYGATELRALLLDQGFSSVDIYGDWDERPYDHRAVKLILRGRK
jgi:SAM-dependent methyltransferase